MKYYIIAGEASGDLHGANLMKAIKANDSEANFRVWGGDLMEAAGGDLVRHYRDLAFMGFVEVLKNLSAILKNLSFCKNDIINFQPDAIILVDYPGFNLRIAKFAKKKGFKIIYYISPQIWAWKRKRVYQIKRDVDRMIVILPFEEAFYAKYDVRVDYVGHPLLDALAAEDVPSKVEFLKENKLEDKPIIAILPGSREQEITRMLEIMIQVVPAYDDYQFVVSAQQTLPLALFKKIIGNLPVKCLQGKTHDLLHHATAAMVTSGTATLETALIGVPEVVCYKGNAISFEIAKRIVHIKYMSLVNLIMDKPVVKELIQGELKKENLVKELDLLLFDDSTQARLDQDYSDLKTILGQKGASQRAAKIIADELKP